MSRNKLTTTSRMLVAILAAMSLVLAACATDDDDPTIQMARADWSSGHMQAAIYAQLIGELGYPVSDPADNTLNPNNFYQRLDSGEFDLWVNGWFPLHDIYLDLETVAGLSVERDISAVGQQVAGGALQGYMIDKATADAMGINSMSALSDASVAATFDQDGDGKADLIGCDEGWGCNSYIDSHLAELGWGANVEQISGKYGSLMESVIDRVAAGLPVLFYAWTPNWTYEVLAPGTDVVWLESHALEDEEASTSVSGLKGCAADPCDLGWPVSSIQAVANDDFLSDHPDIERLLEAVTIPLADIAVQNAEMVNYDEDEVEDMINAAASAWIEANRSTVDGWLATARG